MFLSNKSHSKQTLKRMKIKLLLLQIVIISLLSSCVTPKDTNLLQDIKKNYPVDMNLNDDYKIIIGDQLNLRIYTLDESMRDLFSVYIITQSTGLSAPTTDQTVPNTLNVYSDGTVKIPYLGKISVEGYTTTEAKKIIEEKFSTFSPNLVVELSLQNRFFSVLGEAGQRRIPMTQPKITIFQALALAGPIQTFADRTKVKIVRQTPNGTEVKVFDIRSKDVVDSEYYYIQPNDVIYMPEMTRTFFGRITTFSGVLGLVGILGTIAAGIALISKF